MPKCSFCGKEERAFKGLHLIRNSGAIDYYCTSKCRNNANKLKRDKRKVRWAEAFHLVRAKAKAKKEAAVKAEKESGKEVKKEVKKKVTKKKSK